jgi:hypothetical protein
VAILGWSSQLQASELLRSDRFRAHVPHRNSQRAPGLRERYRECGRRSRLVGGYTWSGAGDREGYGQGSRSHGADAER